MYEEVHFVLGPSSTSSDHGSMLSEVSPKPPQIFWKAFQNLGSHQPVPGALRHFLSTRSVAFGGAASMVPPDFAYGPFVDGRARREFLAVWERLQLTFLVRSGQKWPRPAGGNCCGICVPSSYDNSARHNSFQK